MIRPSTGHNVQCGRDQDRHEYYIHCHGPESHESDQSDTLNMAGVEELFYREEVMVSRTGSSLWMSLLLQLMAYL